MSDSFPVPHPWKASGPRVYQQMVPSASVMMMRARKSNIVRGSPGHDPLPCDRNYRTYKNPIKLPENECVQELVVEGVI